VKIARSTEKTLANSYEPLTCMDCFPHYLHATLVLDTYSCFLARKDKIPKKNVDQNRPRVITRYGLM